MLNSRGKMSDVLENYQLLRQKKSLRKGQCWFLALSAVNRDIADSLTGSALDPFYDDSRIEKFKQFCQEILEQK